MKKLTLLSLEKPASFLLMMIFCFVSIFVAGYFQMASAQESSVKVPAEELPDWPQWQKYDPSLGVIIVFNNTPRFYGPDTQFSRLQDVILARDHATHYLTALKDRFPQAVHEQIFDASEAYNNNPQLSPVDLKDVYVVRGLSKKEVNELRGDLGVFCVPNWQTKVCQSGDFVPNDPAYFLQKPSFDRMGMGKLYAEQLADIQSGRYGSNSVTVAVIDSGSSPLSDLAIGTFKNSFEIPGNGVDDDGDGLADDVSGYNFVNNSPNVTDYNGHGTDMQSIINSTVNNGDGVAGVAGMMPQVKVLSLVAAGPDGFFSGDTIVKSFNYCVTNALRFHIRIINNSYGDSGSGVSSIFLPIYSALDRMGVLVLYSAGNNNENLDSAVDSQKGLARVANNVLVIGGVDEQDQYQTFSATGVNTIFLAACTKTQGLIPSGLVGQGNGTSGACALVSGGGSLVALKHPEFSGYELKEQLILTSDKFTNYSQYINASGGRIDIWRAVNENPSIPPAPVLAPTITFTQSTYYAHRTIDSSGKKHFVVQIGLNVQSSSAATVVVDWGDGGGVQQNVMEHDYVNKKFHQITAYAFVQGPSGPVNSGKISANEIFQKGR